MSLSEEMRSCPIRGMKSCEGEACSWWHWGEQMCGVLAISNEMMKRNDWIMEDRDFKIKQKREGE